MELTKECFYCTQNNSVFMDYPLNEAIFGLESNFPRCLIHYQFRCDQCLGESHFNGISWCNSCKNFTCVRCESERIVWTDFFVNSYYYEIKCPNCDAWNPTLDYSEFMMEHPFQLGVIIPQSPVNVWIQFSSDYLEKQPSLEFNERRGFHELSKFTGYKDSSFSVPNVLNPVQNWSEIAKDWDNNFDVEGDFHHKNLILPHVLDLITDSDGVVLDVGCGNGNLARILSKSGRKVIGIDPSDMILFAIEKEQIKPLGITYFQETIQEFLQRSQSDFKHIVLNMMIMDVEDLRSLAESLGKLTIGGGEVIISLLHPCFDVSTKTTIKFPQDSQHNEDKVFIVDNYFKEEKSWIKFNISETKTVHFHRTLSTYVNILSENGLLIDKMVEPVPKDSLYKTDPRETFLDYDRIPLFLILRCKKISSNFP